MDYNSKKIHTVYSMELHNILDEIILIANKLLGENRGIELPLEKYKFFKDSHWNCGYQSLELSVCSGQPEWAHTRHSGSVMSNVKTLEQSLMIENVRKTEN